MSRIASLFALVLMLIAPAAAQVPYAPEENGDFRAAPRDAEQVRLSFAPVVRQAAPAVVNVFSSRVVRQRNPFDDFFGRGLAPRERVQSSLGSGVIVDASGVIVTNNHVVAGAQELRVVLADRREYEAELLLADERTDLAVLRIHASEPLPVLPYDERGDTEVGDLVLAIGNPFGVGQTVTSGIISALARTEVGVTDFAFFIQTDAAINPGNSGGALVDMDGRLIGINTAIYSRTGGSIGIGFAIPVEMVRRVVEAAVGEGVLVRPWMGARLQTVTGDIAGTVGLDRPRGAIVTDVYPGAAADRAGLRRGDVVLSIDGVAVNDEPGARFRLATRAIGEQARLTVLRDGAERALTLAAEPAPGAPAPDNRVIDGRNPFAGAEVANLSPAFNEEHGLDPFLRGVVVMRVQRGSAADYFGFQPGDRVTEVLGEPVNAVRDLARTLERADDARQWPIAIERRGQRFARTLRM
ncbi:MAG: Do family serine endopeptidase [Maricaulaceae bacterium]|nr:Do family serine endopeptidase [Maricaulaceae bacterium]